MNVCLFWPHLFMRGGSCFYCHAIVDGKLFQNVWQTIYTFVMYWYLFEGFIPYFYCDMRSCAPVTARYWHRKYGDATKGIIQDTIVQCKSFVS